MTKRAVIYARGKAEYIEQKERIDKESAELHSEIEPVEKELANVPTSAELETLEEFIATIRESISDQGVLSPELKRQVLEMLHAKLVIDRGRYIQDRALVWSTCRGSIEHNVNTFCPRLFSATRIPDPILASRTIVVPLIRTLDRKRANANPLDYKLWPPDRRKPIDDLWALAAAYLAQVQSHEELINQKARPAGRSPEPWRAILAVVLWLEDNGVTGLWHQMEALSESYQAERTDLEYGDLTALTIRALCAKCANLIGDSPIFDVTAKEVAGEAKLIIELQNSEFSPDSIAPQRMGLQLRKFRLRKPPRAGGKGPRTWGITLDELERHCAAYGLTLPNDFKKLLPASEDPSPRVGTVGEVGPVGTEDDDLREGEL